MFGRTLTRVCLSGRFWMRLAFASVLDVVSVRIRGLSEDAPPRRGWTLSDQLRARIEQKDGEV